MDRTLNYMELLRADVDSGRADRHAHAELSKSEETYDIRMREFTRYAPSYGRNSKKVFDWCENLESHLAAYSWEKIPNDQIKMMLLSCIKGSGRQEIIVLSQPEGLALESYEIEEFFTELLKKFTQEKDKEGRKQEYIARKQERNKDPWNYYTDKLRLWVQAYPPAKRSLVEFKNAMLLGLYSAKWRIFFA